MRTSWLAGLLFGLCVSLAGASEGLAQDTAKASPEGLAAAQKMLRVTGTEKTMGLMSRMMMTQMMNVLAKAKPGKEDEVKVAQEVAIKLFEERTPELIGQFAELYAKKFTVKELEAITTFYESPEGKKFIAEQPQLMQAGQQLGRKWAQDMQGELGKRITKELSK